MEHGDLTSLIVSTTGCWGKEPARFHKQLTNLLIEKRREQNTTVMSFIRKRLRSLLRTTLESLRSFRGLRRTFIQRALKIIDIDISILLIKQILINFFTMCDVFFNFLLCFNFLIRFLEKNRDTIHVGANNLHLNYIIIFSVSHFQDRMSSFG